MGDRVKFLPDGRIIGWISGEDLVLRYELVLESAARADLVPQAVLRLDIDTLVAVHPAFRVDDTDDLDHFVGLRFCLDGIPMAVFRYDGFPAGTASLYLAITVQDAAVITQLVERAVTALGLEPACILWQRCHGEGSPEWAAVERLRNTAK